MKEQYAAAALFGRRFQKTNLTIQAGHIYGRIFIYTLLFHYHPLRFVVSTRNNYQLSGESQRFIPDPILS